MVAVETQEGRIDQAQYDLLQWGHGLVAVETRAVGAWLDPAGQWLQWGHGLVAVETNLRASLYPVLDSGFNGATAW